MVGITVQNGPEWAEGSDPGHRGGPEEIPLDIENISPYDDPHEIIFRGDESPKERARKILEQHKPETRPTLIECQSCRLPCKQRKATDAVILFTCFDRKELEP